MDGNTEARRQARGKLTVFLGATAGVGKTYAMLEAARERLDENVDVVIGRIETHGRPETEKMADGMPRIAAATVEYRGRPVAEMDVDAVLARRPALVLVDELAHTNVPGLRHIRRFQDVEEFLAAGIDVYTTLNIQNIESLNDVVTQITGVVVRETVPDHVIGQADKVQLVDIPSEDLIQRLREGKVHIPGQAEQALRQFYRAGNINALRELSLRFTASRVDRDLHDYMREHDIKGPWPASGRVMVGVSGSPLSAMLIRAASRLAGGMQAECLAVHVELTGPGRPGAVERDRIVHNLRLAEELGARTLSVEGGDWPEKMLEVARANNVSTIVVGKPRRGRLQDIFRGSEVDRLIRRSGNIDIYVIRTEQEQPARAPKEEWNADDGETPRVLAPYGASLAMVAAATAFSYAIREVVEFGNIALLYQLPIVLSAFWWGRWPAYFTGISSVLIYDFMFIPPVFTFSVDDIRFLWSFLTFLVVAFVIGGRTEQLRHEAVTAKMREKSTRALFEFSREIAAVIDPALIARQLAIRAADAMNRRVFVLLPDKTGRLVVWSGTASGMNPGAATEGIGQPLADEAEAEVAAWVFGHRQMAGRSTGTLPGAENLYLPLATRENIMGVLGIHIVEKLITPEQRQLMEAWAGLAALAIERAQLAEKARGAALVLESDKLRTALLNSITHELRTPLASIIGSASTLLEADALYSPEDRRELLENIKEGSSRMNLILSNLLDTARIESGMMKLKDDWCDIEDIIGSSLRHLTDQVKGRPLDISIGPDLPLIHGDSVLLGQVLVNLIDNAVKYSPPESRIGIRSFVEDDSLVVEVLDRGSGIPESEAAKVFNKFYRIQRDAGNVPGTGLGLPICKSIIEAHGGSISARNREDGGAVFRFRIPLDNDIRRPVLPDAESR